MKKNFFQNQSGAMLIMTLVFTGLFTVMAIGISSMIAAQHKLGIKKIAWNQALAVAEAGINYYKWHLAHAPEDYQNGTGAPGPYVHDYQDNLGNTIGQFSLEISAPAVSCNNDGETIIESTGWMNDNPSVRRTIKAKYGRRSLAQFAFLTNSNAWFADTENLNGPLHSNGGIRMDGFNVSVTTSAKSEYVCGAEHGCGGETKPGVWGTGGDQALWDFPVDNIDFDAVTVDLANLKAIAQNSDCGGGNDCYWPQLGLGYHLNFNNDGTFDIYRVTRKMDTVWSYNGEDWERDSDDFDRETFEGTYNLPGNCGIIFVEDDLWIDGTVRGGATVAATRTVPGQEPKVIINGDIVYSAKDGSDVLGIIAESNIQIPLYAAPDNLEIDAVLLAQKGRVTREYYCSACSKKVPKDAKSYVLRDTVTVYGSIITNKTWTWSWVDGADVVSGYKNTLTNYDPNLTYNPPPGFPTTGEYRVLRWEEITEKK